MDGDIGPTIQHPLFQLLDEQALAADLGQRAYRGSWSPWSGHADQLDLQAGMGLPQACGDVFGLPQGELAFTGGDAQDWFIHAEMWEISGSILNKFRLTDDQA
jgi:hypothetical protein